MNEKLFISIDTTSDRKCPLFIYFLFFQSSPFLSLLFYCCKTRIWFIKENTTKKLKCALDKRGSEMQLQLTSSSSSSSLLQTPTSYRNLLFTSERTRNIKILVSRIESSYKNTCCTCHSQQIINNKSQSKTPNILEQHFYNNQSISE